MYTPVKPMPKKSIALAVGVITCLILFGAGCQANPPPPPVPLTTTPITNPSVTPPTSMSVPTAKRFDVASAQVESEIKGDFAHGKETALFNDWGLHASIVTQQDGVESKSITLTDADWSYAFATGDKNGLKSPMDPAATWHADSGVDFGAFTAQGFAAKGFEQAGTRVIAGKTCDVWKHVINPMTICVWKGIPMYLETYTPDKTQKSIVEAVKVTENPTVAADAFMVPSDIKFQETSF